MYKLFIHLLQHSVSRYQYIYNALMRFMVDQSQYGGELKIEVRDRTSRITLLTEINKLCVEKSMSQSGGSNIVH